jgi:hypothetical protein
MSEEELLEAIRIPGSYVLDSLPGGVYVITPMEPGEIKNTEGLTRNAKATF